MQTIASFSTPVSKAHNIISTHILLLCFQICTYYTSASKYQIYLIAEHAELTPLEAMGCCVGATELRCCVGETEFPTQYKNHVM